MKERAEPSRVEPRWPVALAIFAVLLLLAVLPERVRLFPVWFTHGIGMAVFVSIAVVGLTAAKPRWLRVERTAVLLFFVIKAAANLASLAYLIDLMVRGSTEAGGLKLLASSTAVWVNNVLVFSLLYWQIDRGGPEARMAHARSKPDWLFPQEGAPAEDSTGTAFSTTDAMPLTSRAKLLMMLESTISLLTVVVVASRAINILAQ
jgi:hypothetical protein